MEPKKIIVTDNADSINRLLKLQSENGKWEWMIYHPSNPSNISGITPGCTYDIAYIDMSMEIRNGKRLENIYDELFTIAKRIILFASEFDDAKDINRIARNVSSCFGTSYLIADITCTEQNPQVVLEQMCHPAISPKERIIVYLNFPISNDENHDSLKSQIGKFAIVTNGTELVPYFGTIDSINNNGVWLKISAGFTRVFGDDGKLSIQVIEESDYLPCPSPIPCLVIENSMVKIKLATASITRSDKSFEYTYKVKIQHRPLFVTTDGRSYVLGENIFLMTNLPEKAKNAIASMING